MITAAPKSPKRETWKIVAELLFVAWVVVINVLYYAQFRARALKLLGQFFHR